MNEIFVGILPARRPYGKDEEVSAYVRKNQQRIACLPSPGSALRILSDKNLYRHRKNA